MQCIGKGPMTQKSLITVSKKDARASNFQHTELKVLHLTRHKIGHVQRRSSQANLLAYCWQKTPLHNKSKQRKNKTAQITGRKIQNANLKVNLNLTVRNAHECVPITAHYRSTQYSTEQFRNLPSYPPDNRHSSDVYWRVTSNDDRYSKFSHH